MTLTFKEAVFTSVYLLHCIKICTVSFPWQCLLLLLLQKVALRYPLSWKNEIKLFPVSDYVEFFSELHIQNENHCYFSFLFDPSWNMWL